MSNNSKTSNTTMISGIIILAAILTIVIILIMLLFNTNETKISSDTQIGSFTSLECSGSSIEDAFFASSKAQRHNHEIRVLFTNNRLKDASYSYEGTCNSSTLAENEMAVLHAEYNKYMGNNNVYQEILNPVFSTDKSKIRISLYLEPKAINTVTGKLFFMSDEFLEKLKDASEDDFKEMYQKRGFKCSVHE